MVPFVLPKLYGAVISAGSGKAVQGGFLSRQSSRWHWVKLRQFRLSLNQDWPLFYKFMNNYVGPVLVCILCSGLGFSFSSHSRFFYVNIHERHGGVVLGGARGGAPELPLARSRGDGGGGGSSGHWRPGPLLNRAGPGGARECAAAGGGGVWG